MNAILFSRELVCYECLWRDGSSILSGSNAGAPTEHNRFKE
jgi:hypothetical protein